jgi:hypothetical protein
MKRSGSLRNHIAANRVDIDFGKVPNSTLLILVLMLTNKVAGLWPVPCPERLALASVPAISRLDAV